MSPSGLAPSPSRRFSARIPSRLRGSISPFDLSFRSLLSISPFDLSFRSLLEIRLALPRKGPYSIRVTQPRVLLAITLLLVSAGLSVRRWIAQPREATGAASGAAICTASSDPGASCVLPRSGHPLRVAGISSAAVSVAFSAGVALVLLLGLLGSAALQQRVARNAFRILAIAVVVDVVLIVLQLFVWHDVCALCLASYGMTIVAAVLLRRPSDAAQI